MGTLFQLTVPGVPGVPTHNPKTIILFYRLCSFFLKILLKRVGTPGTMGMNFPIPSFFSWNDSPIQIVYYFSVEFPCTLFQLTDPGVPGVPTHNPKIIILFYRLCSFFLKILLKRVGTPGTVGTNFIFPKPSFFLGKYCTVRHVCHPTLQYLRARAETHPDVGVFVWGKIDGKKSAVYK